MAKCVAWCSLALVQGSKARACNSPRPPQMCVQCHVTISAFQGFSLRTSGALQRCCLHQCLAEVNWFGCRRAKRKHSVVKIIISDNGLAKCFKLNVNRLCHCPALIDIKWLQLLLYRCSKNSQISDILCSKHPQMEWPFVQVFNLDHFAIQAQVKRQTDEAEKVWKRLKHASRREDSLTCSCLNRS